MPRNLFQTQLDSVASPLLTTPAPAPFHQLPTTPNAGLGALQKLPSVGGIDVGGLLHGLGGGSSGGPLHPAAPRLAAPSIPAPLDSTLQTQPGGSSSWVSGVVRAAHETGVDPRLAVAIALEESGGNSRAVGDSGSSYGLFQLHKGGALGNMPVTAAPGGAFDPYSNAHPVLAAWGRLGGGQGMDPKAALMQYYSQVGRGSSNEIPTQRALGLLDRAGQLVGGASSGGPASGQTLADRTAAAPVGGGALSPQGLTALMGMAMKMQKEALQGKAPDMAAVMRMADPIMRAIMTPTGQVQAGLAPPVDPGSSGREHVATQAALSVLGTPYLWGGTNPKTGIDCSALIQYAWGKAGVSVPRTTWEQMKIGQSVPNLAAAQPGDLLFSNGGEHVRMYLGNGQAVESPHTGASVRTIPVAGMTFYAIRRPG